MLGNNTKKRIRQAGIVAVMMMLVMSPLSSAFAGFVASPQTSSQPAVSPVGTASADLGTQGSCVDDVGFTLVSMPASLYSNAVDPCWEPNVDKNMTNVSIYEDGVAMHQFKNETLTEVQNNLIGAKSAARTEAKIAFAKAIKNGSTQAEAVQAGKQAAADYYAQIQKRQVGIWNTSVTQTQEMRIEYLYAEGVSDPENNTTYSTHLYRKWVNQDGSAYNTPSGQVVRQGGPETLTLVNGSTVDAKSLYYSSSVNATYFTEPGGSLMAFYTNTPDTTETIIVDTAKYNRVHDEIVQQESEVQASLGNESSGYLADAYTLVDAGVLNVSDLFSAKEWAAMNLDSQDIGNRTYYNMQMAYLGYGGASYNMSMQVTLQDNSSINGVTISGDKTFTDAQIFTRAEPSTKFEENNTTKTGWITNHTYDTANYNETVYLVYTTTTEETVDGEVVVTTELHRATISGKFEIDSITNVDTGEAQTGAGYVDREQKAANASEFNQQIENIHSTLDELQNQLERQQSGGGGTGTCGITIPLGFTTICTGIQSMSVGIGVALTLGAFALWVLIKIGIKSYIP